jgi:hypothetical protein
LIYSSDVRKNTPQIMDTKKEYLISSVAIHYVSPVSTLYNLIQEKINVAFYRSSKYNPVYASIKYSLMEQIYTYLTINFNFRQEGNRLINTDFPELYVNNFIATEDYPEPSGIELMAKLRDNMKVLLEVKHLVDNKLKEPAKK